MRKMIFILVAAITIACTGADKSPAETAQIVVESFYKKNFSTMKKYTTKEAYESFMYIQDAFPTEESRDSHFRILQVIENGDTPWENFLPSMKSQRKL